MFWILTGGLALYGGLQVLRTKHQLERAQLTQGRHPPRRIGLLEAAITASFDTGDRIADGVNQGYAVYARIRDRHDAHREKQQYLAWLDEQRALTDGEDHDGEEEEGDDDDEEEEEEEERMEGGNRRASDLGEGSDESDDEGAESRDSDVGVGEGGTGTRGPRRMGMRGGRTREPTTPPSRARGSGGRGESMDEGESMRESMRAGAARGAASSGPRSMDDMLRHVPAYTP